MASSTTSKGCALVQFATPDEAWKARKPVEGETKRFVSLEIKGIQRELTVDKAKYAADLSKVPVKVKKEKKVHQTESSSNKYQTSMEEVKRRKPRLMFAPRSTVVKKK